MAAKEAQQSEFPGSAWRIKVRRRMLRWFDTQARQLPWRPSPGLYETWVSEIMLQQTQVATVIPYFERFLKRFPSVNSLAAASEAEVLRYWEGLGYYRRGRQLHQAAGQIVEQHGGRFPTTIEQVLALPGVGRYTAGAILSIGLDQPHPILEGNTIRLFSRWLALRDDPHSGGSQKQLWAFAEWLLPKNRVGDLNQAMMELGSTVCGPRKPDCQNCPVVALCPTFAGGWQDQIPRSTAKTVYLRTREAAVVVQANGKLLLRQCQKGERWEGLWDFPRFPIGDARGKQLQTELARGVTKLTGLTVTMNGHLTTIRHAVTRYRITLICHLASCTEPPRLSNEMKWVKHDDASEYPLSVTGRKIWELLRG